jgi:hypothetical protein
VGGQEYSRASSFTYSQAWFDPLTKKVGGPLTPLTPWNRSHCILQKRKLFFIFDVYLIVSNTLCILYDNHGYIYVPGRSELLTVVHSVTLLKHVTIKSRESRPYATYVFFSGGSRYCCVRLNLLNTSIGNSFAK